MISSFHHRGLKQFYERGCTRYLNAEHVPRIRRILGLLDAANSPQGLDLPGFRLHALKGKFTGCWAVSVSGNWRIAFRFESGNACEVDLVDYH